MHGFLKAETIIPTGYIYMYVSRALNNIMYVKLTKQLSSNELQTIMESVLAKVMDS